MGTINCRALSVTLREVWKEFKKSRHIKEKTLKNYETCLFLYLADWLDLPLNDITKDMVECRHQELTQRGKTTANDVFRRLRAVWNYALVKYEDEEGNSIILRNPVSRLTEVRAWHQMQRRRTVIPIRSLSCWLKGVWSLENTTTRDLLLLLLLTGMRSGEAKQLRWKDVDLDGGVINLQHTKNGLDHRIPLSDYAWRMLLVRKHASVSDYVFPTQLRMKSAPISNLNSSLRLVAERSGVSVTAHDLRRTYITIGDELELKSEVIKCLVNHAQGDVTEGYTIRSVERLRRATQRITNAILSYASVAKHAASAPPFQ